MAAHGIQQDATDERLTLSDRARPLVTIAALIGVGGLILSLALGWSGGNGLARFYFAYLTAYAFFLSIALGAMFFLLMQHLTGAAWSVTIRRITESFLGLFPLLALLSLPILVSVVVQKGDLYRWALPVTPEAEAAAHRAEAEPEPEPAAHTPGEHASDAAPRKPVLDAVMLKKRAWLNPWFFVARIAIYFAAWIVIAQWYRRQSVEQDTTGDIEATRRMQKRSGIAIVILGLTLTGAAGDLLMSLDPHWYSTMLGVYYFSGSTLAIFASLIIGAYVLQRLGYLRRSISKEHYHDLGKYLFGFTFFWGYIAFSQYMLMWYASLPEEIQWFSRHGATTDPRHVSGWSWVVVALLFGQLLIPFAGVMSRHVKRVPGLLALWAVWVLVFHYVDLFWVVMPEYGGAITATGIVANLAALVGLGGIVLAAVVAAMAPRSLRPLRDPRLPESLAFQNI